jgi:hypothetical protein
MMMTNTNMEPTIFIDLQDSNTAVPLKPPHALKYENTQVGVF